MSTGLFERFIQQNPMNTWTDEHAATWAALQQGGMNADGTPNEKAKAFSTEQLGNIYDTMPGLTKFSPEQVSAFQTSGTNPFPGQGVIGNEGSYWAASPDSEAARYAEWSRGQGDEFSTAIRNVVTSGIPGNSNFLRDPANLEESRNILEGAPGLGILALPFAGAGITAAVGAGGAVGAEGGAVAGAGGGAASGGGAGGGAAAGSESMFGPGSADALDASLIGPNAGAAAGSGSQFAPDAAGLFPGESTTSGPAFVGEKGIETVSPETAQLLGINDGFSAQIPGEFGGVEGDFSTPLGGGTITGGGGGDFLAPGDYNLGYEGEASGANYGKDAGGGSGYFDDISAYLKKLGLSPASAGMLGLAGIQALKGSKEPEASKTLGANATQNSQFASATIQSGGTSSPAWAGQKSSIDATIDEQLRQQTAALLQQAIRSGMGAQSQVTQQQINKLKTQLETQRQALYAQAQQQNVQVALQALGISNQALSQVANAQFSASNAGKSSAAQTAQLALQLQALANRGSSSASVADQGRREIA